MKLGPLEIQWRTKALPPLQPLSGRSGWWNVIREPFIGGWQTNQEVRAENVLTYSAVFRCVTMISADIGKLCLRLVEEDDNGIWNEVENSAFSPVLRKPNHYQTTPKFIEQWITSKLLHGNAYVLKQRDNRRVVTRLYILDPTRVIPLVSPDGAVYYQLRRDDLSGLPEEAKTVPAREIIHDTMIALFHPLIGVTPLYACGLAAMQGLSIQSNSNKFFESGSQPGGVLTAPGFISQEAADRVKAYWDNAFTGDNVGKVAVLGDGLTYTKLGVNAVDSQLIEQLQWTGQTVCTSYGVPAYMAGIGDPPPYANVEPLVQQYYSQCLQTLTTNLETSLDEGLGLGREFGNNFGTEFDIDDLIWMNQQTRNEAAQKGINSGGMSPNEARKKYFALGPVDGGDTPYMQQQNYSLSALDERDRNQPFATPSPTSTKSTEDEDAMAYLSALYRKSIEEGLYAA